MGTADPGGAARSGWLNCGEALPVASGISRLNWALDGKYLTGWEEWHEPELAREEALLVALDIPGIATPTVVATRWNTAIYRDGQGWVWMMTEAMRGLAGDPGDGTQCQAAAEALAEVHRALAVLPRALAVRQSGPMEAIRDALTTDRPAAEGGCAMAVVDDAKAWLSRHLDVLEQSPAHMIHGDWKLRNLRFESATPARVSGALDFERSSVAPVAFDLVQLLGGSLRSSARQEADGLPSLVLRRYQMAGGELVSHESLVVALVAYWFDNWLWLDARVAMGETRLSPALARQPARMAAALRFARQYARSAR